MLKNWTITTQAVKNATDGVIARERYLLAKNHPNHRTTEALISLIGNQQTSQRIAMLGEQFRVKQRLSRKGGRPLSSYAVEFCLTLPKGHRPTPEQWKAIVADCYQDLVKLLDLTPDESNIFKRQIRAVLHQQQQTGRRGSGDHLHLIIGKVLNGRVLKALQQKKGTKLLKQSFNASVLKHVGLDHREYQPYELNRGKRLETWKYREQKAAEAEQIQRTVAKLQSQADKWFHARKKQNTQQQNRQLNRLLKTFEELKSMNLSPELKRDVKKLKRDIGHNSMAIPSNKVSKYS